MSEKLIHPPMQNVFDVEKPRVEPGQLLCDGCWATSTKNLSGWVTFNFKHLKQTNLCPKCVPVEGPRLAEMQERGL